MQDALARLAAYWSEQGCLVVQPMNTEVGAGTLNPATALRVLGPEPWKVAYVEPSVRPDDARYGENPNRLQTHTQYQVILKPEPGNPQELYLGSLVALGIDVEAHDVRFVEDNWASPALGAWGLGWEVWLDGLEITQFTYFQQAGGQPLDPTSVEITYGMERILMALQGVRHFRDIVYTPGLTYGELFGQAEYEMSRYYLDDADVAATRGLLDTFAAEAERLVEAGLPVPAHVHVLKMSHAFNVLDSRGAVSTAERAAEFARMRRLSGAVAQLWVATRQNAGFPLLTSAARAGAAGAGPGKARAVSGAPAPASQGMVLAASPRTLLFEIGVEEMPPAEAVAARDQLESLVAKKLADGRLAHGALTVTATPRRLVATVADVAARETDATRTVRGPKVSAAFRPDGTPTPAASGFARANGVDVAALARITENGVEHLAVVRHEPGRPAADALEPALADAVRKLRASKNMRWNNAELSFTRPIRWIVALLGEAVIPLEVGGLVSGQRTTLARVAPGQASRAGIPATVELTGADGHPAAMDRAGIIVDPAARRERIVATATRLAAEAGGHVDVAAEARLLDEVSYLVEQPTPIVGGFDPGYLELPEAVLTTVMRKHQRYLPVRAGAAPGPAGGRASPLLPRFVAVANGTVDADAVRAGNEAVLRARFEDAAFFYRADLKTPLTTMLERLRRLTFTDKLGSMADRAGRIAALAAELAAQVAAELAAQVTAERAAQAGPSLTEVDRAVLARASELVKFDLGSQMVIELTSLAGTMAHEYALAAGEPPAVATALLEAELPRSAGGPLPGTTPGALLALADRLDALVGLAATVGLPTGSSDPFAVRRAALGALAILRARPELAGLSLRAGLTASAAGQPVDVTAAILDETGAFLARRLELQLVEEGVPVDHVRAVLPHADRPARAELMARQLAGLRGREDFRQIAAALDRARRIVPAGLAAGYDPACLAEPAELALHEAALAVRAHLDALGSAPDLVSFTQATAPLVAPVTRFFEDILVMADDPDTRATRLGLLATVRDLGDGILDWSALTG